MGDYTGIPPKPDPVKVLVRDGCVGCEQVKEVYAPEISQGDIVLVNVKTPEGERLVHDHKVEYVPFFFKDKGGGEIRRCEVRPNGESRPVIDCDAKPEGT